MPAFGLEHVHLRVPCLLSWRMKPDLSQSFALPFRSHESLHPLGFVNFGGQLPIYALEST